MGLLSFAGVYPRLKRRAQDRLHGVYPEPVEGILAMTNKQGK